MSEYRKAYYETYPGPKSPISQVSAELMQEGVNSITLEDFAARIDQYIAAHPGDEWNGRLMETILHHETLIKGIATHDPGSVYNTSTFILLSTHV